VHRELCRRYDHAGDRSSADVAVGEDLRGYIAPHLIPTNGAARPSSCTTAATSPSSSSRFALLVTWRPSAASRRHSAVSPNPLKSATSGSSPCLDADAGADWRADRSWSGDLSALLARTRCGYGTSGIDHESGLVMPGLSVNPLDAPGWVAVDGGQGGPPRVPVPAGDQGGAPGHGADGEVIDFGPDNEPLLVEVQPNAWLSEAAVRGVRQRYDERLRIRQLTH